MTGPDRIYLDADADVEDGYFPRCFANPKYCSEPATEYIRRDPAVLAAMPEVQALIAEAVVAVTHPGGWNPRYIAYAKDNGRGPAAQLEHDAKSPSGMMGFVRWVDRCLAIFKGQHPEAFTGGYLKDGSAFDAWLEGLIVPIFASDEDALLRRADIMVGMLRMGEGIAFGSDADMIADLAAAIRKRGEG